MLYLLVAAAWAAPFTNCLNWGDGRAVAALSKALGSSVACYSIEMVPAISVSPAHPHWPETETKFLSGVEAVLPGYSVVVELRRSIVEADVEARATSEAPCALARDAHDTLLTPPLPASVQACAPGAGPFRAGLLRVQMKDGSTWLIDWEADTLPAARDARRLAKRAAKAVSI